MDSLEGLAQGAGWAMVGQAWEVEKQEWDSSTVQNYNSNNRSRSICEGKVEWDQRVN